MTTYTPISNALVAVGAKPFATTVQAFRDNLLAAMEGDATAVAAGVTLKDPALDTGAATAAGITWVGLRTAGLSAGAVGSYGLFRVNGAVTINFGGTVAGSTLTPGGVAGPAATPAIVGSGSAPAGTWRCMGYTNPTGGNVGVTLFLRIS